MKAEGSASVARIQRKPYGRSMLAARLARRVVLLALILAPLGMIGTHAMAMPAPAVSNHDAAGVDHCPGTDQPTTPKPVSCVDCMMVCSALPPVDGEVAAHPIASALPHIRLIQRVHSLHPESDPPPPRIA